ncbi:hypothetical protein [Frigidibacter sp. MR17.24]|uniref:hypothetical protein n=1 Tax=Frigidibacter sp. MR17.24 TaxID=3127345 RepID=UPI003012DB4E
MTDDGYTPPVPPQTQNPVETGPGGELHHRHGRDMAHPTTLQGAPIAGDDAAQGAGDFITRCGALRAWAREV